MRGSGGIDQFKARAPGVVTIAVALAIGIALGAAAMPASWPWLCVAAAAVVAALLLRRDPRRSHRLIVAAALAFGAAWAAARMGHAPADSIARRAAADGALARVRGTVLDRPRRSTRSDRLARFGHWPDTVAFTLRVDALLDGGGHATRCSGRLRVIVDEDVGMVRPGDCVEILGVLRASSVAMNPGGFDRAAADRRRGIAGTVAVPDRRLITPRPDRMKWSDRLRRTRASLQDRALDTLLAALPTDTPPRSKALLAAVLLGRRDLPAEQVDDAFRRVGVAHVLAISGLHLGVVAGLALLLLRWSGRRSRWHGVVVIVVVLAYLLLVEIRMSVLRAAVMAIIASAAIVCGRRLSLQGLVGASATILLLLDPAELQSAGFQLSFGVVLGLVVLVPWVRRRRTEERLAGRPPATVRAMLGSGLAAAALVSFVAWLVATPLTLHHFGLLSPLAAPLGVVLVPATAILLSLGYLTLALMIAPPVAEPLGAALAGWSGAIIAAVDGVDGIAGSSMHLTRPSGWWALSALAVVALWARYGLRRRVLTVAGSAVAVTGWLLLSQPQVRAGFADRPALRVDAIAVGAGSCYLIRSGGQTVLFDAGSRTDRAVARRTIIPALRALGVRRLDVVVISHPNLDHYGAVPEIVDELRGPGRVILTEHFLAHAEAEPAGPSAWLLRHLERRDIDVATVAAGHVERLGLATWRWLHPLDGERTGGANDGSMVIRIEAAGRAVLMTGDVERRAIARLLERSRRTTLTADVLELPHHGSYDDAAVELLAAVDPRIVLQSSSRARWLQDRWRAAAVMTGRRRLITARDGACTVTITREGRIESSTWLAPD